MDSITEKKKQKRQLWLVLIVVFAGFIGISMPYLIFPALFLNPEYSILPDNWSSSSSQALFLGVTLAVYPLGQFIGSPILGALSDDYGRKGLLSISLFIAALSTLLSGVAIASGQLGLLIASRFITGFTEGNIAIARAMAADLKTIPKHESFGKINAVINIAYLIGPFLGGLMADKSISTSLTTSTPFYVSSILFFGLSGLALLVLGKTNVTPPVKNQTAWQRINFIKKMWVLFSNKQLQFIILVSTAFTLSVDIFYEFGPVYLTLKWTLGPAELIYYNGVLCVALAIGNAVLPRFFASRILNRQAICYCILGFALFLLGIAFANTSILMLSLFTLIGLAIGLAVTLITVKISDSAPDTIQGEVMGVQSSLRVLGDALICLFGSALLLLSPKLILIIAALMSIGTALYYAKSRSV